MSTATSHLVKLVALARETSSASRRELLREISDLFIEDPTISEGAVGAQADDILMMLAEEMEDSVRLELAERFAEGAAAPKGLVRQLALDAFAVARPLLERGALDESTLVDVARRKGQEHLRAIAGRASVPEAVSSAIVARGDETTLVTLVSNAGAQISRESFEILTERAETLEGLRAPLVERPEAPVDLLAEMLQFVGDKLRDRILARADELDPDAFDAALAAAAGRVRIRAGALPRDLDDAVRYIQAKKLRRKLDPELLAEFLERRERTKFLVAFADVTGLDYAGARRVLDSPAVDALAIACRASHFTRDDFLRLAILRDTHGAKAVTDADALGDIYDCLPLDAAERVMRFWRVRKDAAATTAKAA